MPATTDLLGFIADMELAAARLPEHMEEVSKKQAQEIAERARSIGTGLGGVQAKAADGIGTDGDHVVLDGFNHPYIFGAEWGGGGFGPGHPTQAGGHTTQFPPFRSKGGYMVYTAAEELGDDIEDAYGDEIEAVVEHHPT